MKNNNYLVIIFVVMFFMGTLLGIRTGAMAEENEIPAALMEESSQELSKIKRDIEMIDYIMTNQYSEKKILVGHLEENKAEFVMTAYSLENPTGICGTGDGITATGKVATPGRTVAVDPNVIPYGTWLYIPGYGLRRAEDTGSLIKGNRIDLLVYTANEAYSIGVKTVDVIILG